MRARHAMKDAGDRLHETAGPYDAQVRVAGAPLYGVRIAGRSPYRRLWDLQKHLWNLRRNGEIADTLILLEHEPTITLGKSADEAHLCGSRAALQSRGFEVIDVDRGGDVTYHGPGQLTGYLIADLKDLALDLHRYVRGLEEVMIRALRGYGVTGARIPGLTGVWVDGEKIGAIGVHMSRWVSTHGFAFNVRTALDAFQAIVPCGIADRGVTSLERLLPEPSELDEAADRLARAAAEVFRRRLRPLRFPSAAEAVAALQGHGAELLAPAGNAAGAIGGAARHVLETGAGMTAAGTIEDHQGGVPVEE
ncbi:MAG: lipoyl(octanoyl) transferase LipB [Candidatus Eisenbacteria bacterium]|nr:lipoyl(octanoyl) transferase LipB [Candidatus Eisenbacteria bacterium]